MKRPPTRSTRTYTLFPYTTLVRSDDREVGVAGRQATAVVVDRPGPRQRKQPVGPAVAGPQGGDLVGHRLELGVMRVGRGVAGLEDDGVIGGEAGEGVDVGVGVVALEVAVVEPQHAVLGEPRSEEHTSELQSLMRISYAVFCLKK